MSLQATASRICAERVAIYNAISAGYKKITSLAVATENGGMPCGVVDKWYGISVEISQSTFVIKLAI